MRSISDTIAKLSALRGTLPDGLGSSGADRLQDLFDFGSNPGNLLARMYVPADLEFGAPLVVVLHGCTQTAASYDHGSGWSLLADRHGFAVLYPQQQRSNNPNLCFNWFQPQDAQRGSGEALSIRQMIEQMVSDHGLDSKRVFVTGLSAGGAMTAVMLATYPDVFAGGGIIAGLPFGSAKTIPEAFDRMRGHGGPTDKELGALVQRATHHKGPWPTVSIWHGDADFTVSPSNAGSSVAQWGVVHDLDTKPTYTDDVDGHLHRVWSAPDGRKVIEEYVISGLGHGVPLNVTLSGNEVAGAYMLDAGISSTEHIAQFWKLIPAPKQGVERPVKLTSARQVNAAPAPSKGASSKPLYSKDRAHEPSPSRTQKVDGVRKVIEDALRTAGLMK